MATGADVGRGMALGLGPGAEFDLIRRFLPDGTRAVREDVLVGPGDDCAVVVANGIALSSDLCVEGIHFRREWLAPAEIGFRAASAALSDLAAVAARPIGVLASLAITAGDASTMGPEVMAGVRDAVERVGGMLLGGDLTRSPGPLVLDVTAVGESSQPVLRSGARPGDELWVTGELGAAALCVSLLLEGRPAPALARPRFARPTPRTREAIWLRERGVLRAMLDLSDGLAGDLTHLAAASGVAVVVERGAVPVHPAVVAAGMSEGLALDLALSGGEDYELCFAAAPGMVQPIEGAFAAAFGVRLSRVGWVEAGEGAFLVDANGQRSTLHRGGFQHFAEGR